MTHLSEKDWELLNAYHDGEMSPSDARKFKARLASEAELKSTLLLLREASNSLSTLRPVPFDRTPNRDTVTPIRSRLAWLAGGAIAASVVFAVAINALGNDRNTLLDIHNAHLKEDYTVVDGDLLAVSTTAAPEIPDLTGGNLQAVSLSSFPAGTVAHYSGRNGCRLTYFRGHEPLDLPTAVGSQTQGWTTDDGLHHAILATGMDAQKFNAISAYLQNETRRQSLDRAYAAMKNATETAAPCIS